jgi:hypothetical protein
MRLRRLRCFALAATAARTRAATRPPHARRRFENASQNTHRPLHRIIIHHRLTTTEYIFTRHDPQGMDAGVVTFARRTQPVSAGSKRKRRSSQQQEPRPLFVVHFRCRRRVWL